MKPRFFASPGAFRVWLEAHHAKAGELLVGFHKRDTGRPSLTWSESVDEALCFGWIDGVRKSLGGERYQIRFTPRRAGSTWSKINVGKVAALTAAGKMRPAGLAAFAGRSAAKTALYTYEQRGEAALDPAQQAQFRANQKAWAWWAACAPGYRKAALFWLGSAKRDETRARRFATLIAACEAGVKIAPLRERKTGRRE